MTVAPDTEPTPTGRAPLDLDAARRVWAEQAARLPELSERSSREERMDHDRLSDQFAREREAIERQVHEVGGSSPSPHRSVLLVHRHEWVSHRIRTQLEAAGLGVLPLPEDGAVAVAGLVVHQPRVLLMSDRVGGCVGSELVRRAAELSPATEVVVQVDADDRMREVMSSGARAVLSHRQPVEEVVARVLHLVDA